jgi:hypothetical protein
MFSILYSLLLLLLNFLNGGPRIVPRSTNSPKDQAPPFATVRAAYMSLPLAFEPNRGQADPATRYLARGQGYALLLKDNEAWVVLNSAGHPPDSLKRPNRTQAPRQRILRMKLENSRAPARVTGLDRLPGTSNYFFGKNPSRWLTHIPTYAKTKFESVYPGVDLVYYGHHGKLEYDFVLAPGADPGKIVFRFEGRKVQKNEQGDLALDSPAGRVCLLKPVAYQKRSEDASARRTVLVSYVQKGPNRFGFAVRDYDPREPLVIDPVLSYSTYLGGNAGDAGNAIALDSSGNAYVTGSTASSNFPTLSAYKSSYAGDTDAFVTKLNSTGTALIYSTYLGGTNSDSGAGIAVDSSGNAYLTGTTSSTDFPTTSGVFQTALGGGSDAFVAKLDASGSKLLYSSFLGGSSADSGNGIALDTTGNAYVTGSTESTDFPTETPFQSGNAGVSDAFVTKVNNSATAIIYSTYLGGTAADVAQAIAVDAAGSAYVTGYTYSTNFPTVNPYQNLNGGSADVFVSKFSPDGTTLAFSTYIGGSGLDRGMALAVDIDRNVYITGDTASNGFPVSASAYQQVNKGSSDAFVTKLNPPGSAVLVSTLLGGTQSDKGTGIAADSTGNIYVTGFTMSADFPTANAVQASYAGGTCGTVSCTDAFVTEVNPQGTSLVYSTYLGGTGAEYAGGIALDGTGNAYIVGMTTSTDFPATAGAYQGGAQDAGANGDAFVVKIAPDNVAGVALSPQKLDFGKQDINTTSAAQTVTLIDVGTVPLHVTSITPATDFAETDNCVGTIPAGGGRCTINVTFTPTSLQAVTEQISINDDATGSPHLLTLTGTGVNPTTAVTFSPTSLQFASQMVNTTSPPQTVTLQNTGSTTLTITNIAASGDFAETNTCPTSLPVNGTCNITVTFTPTATGTRTGAVTVTDNVSGGSSSISLTGTGTPTYSLTATALSQRILVGTTSATFTISVSAPSTFSDNVALSCESGATCSFSPTPITRGQTSTLTVSGLSASTVNPFSFTVDGTDGNQTAKLPLTIFLQDYSLTATPALNSVAAGQAVTYTVTVTPSNGFTQPVLLSCSAGVPQGGSCSFSPSAVSPSTGAVTATLTVSTTARSIAPPTRIPPKPPQVPLSLVTYLLAFLGAAASLFAAPRRRRENASWRRGRLPFAYLSFATIVLCTALWVGCDNYYYTSSITPASVTGTPVGNYTITIEGTFNGSSTTVNRTTTVNLAVS